MTDIFERALLPSGLAAHRAEAGVADVSGYTDYGRVWQEFLDRVGDDLDPRSTVIALGDARTNGREPHAAHPSTRGGAPGACSGSTPSRVCTGTTATP